MPYYVELHKMKLCHFNVAKLDDCVGPPFANPVTYITRLYVYVAYYEYLFSSELQQFVVT